MAHGLQGVDNVRADLLSPLEIACGVVFGLDDVAVQAAEGPARTPLAALEEAVRPALARPPCVVSFSGGRDSAVVLAFATGLARREGLPLPIPATNRFPEAPESDEREWQELMIGYLKLDDWVRLSFEDELDCVGPVSTRLLKRHGILWPFNSYFHEPIIEASSGGSLLTGLGGDEVFSSSSWARAHAVLTGAVRPTPRDILRVGFALAPRAAKRAAVRQREPVTFPWLTPGARRAATAARASDVASEPLRWDARAGWWQRLRYASLAFRSFACNGCRQDVEVVHPLATVGFWRAVGQVGGARGFASKESALKALFSEQLPSPCSSAVRRRRSTRHSGTATPKRSLSPGMAKGWTTR